MMAKKLISGACKQQTALMSMHIMHAVIVHMLNDIPFWYIAQQGLMLTNLTHKMAVLFLG